MTIRIITLLWRKAVGFVDKEHAIQGTANDFIRFDGCLARVTGHESRAVNLHELTLLQNPQFAQHIRVEARYRCFARSRGSCKYTVETHLHHLQPGRRPLLLQGHHIRQTFHLLFNRGQTHQPIQLLQCLLLFAGRATFRCFLIRLIAFWLKARGICWLGWGKWTIQLLWGLTFQHHEAEPGRFRIIEVAQRPRDLSLFFLPI